MRPILVFVGLAFSRQGVANPALVATDRFAYQDDGERSIDGGIVVGAPTALPTGLATGVTGGVAYGPWGVRAVYASADESSLAWQVTHHEVRLRVTGTAARTLDRASVGLRLGVGGTLVAESRDRNQGERAGLMGTDLRTSATALLPAADLDAVVAVHVQGPWLVTVSAGPSFAVDGGLVTSWNANLGVAWQR